MDFVEILKLYLIILAEVNWGLIGQIGDLSDLFMGFNVQLLATKRIRD